MHGSPNMVRIYSNTLKRLMFSLATTADANQMCECRSPTGERSAAQRPGEGDHDVSTKVGYDAQPYRYYCPGGGRNMTSCFADSATTSGGDCSFMLWIAQ